MNFTALDFETANSKRTSICSVGMAIVEDGVIVETTHQLIKPTPNYFDYQNIAIHGIRPADIEDAPSFEEYWPEMQEKISGPLVAHNASFDMSVLRYILDHLDAPYPTLDYYCTLVMTRIVWQHLRSHKLNQLAQLIGFEFNHHNAEEDAKACAMLVLALSNQLDIGSIAELGKCLPMRVGALYERGYKPCGKMKMVKGKL
jgi:DNA polymerase-3 subunit epsilon